MAMAGQGLTAGPPPRPAHHNSFGQNPGNQLYVGNVRLSAILLSNRAYFFSAAIPGRLAGLEGFVQVRRKHNPRRH